MGYFSSGNVYVVGKGVMTPRQYRQYRARQQRQTPEAKAGREARTARESALEAMAVTQRRAMSDRERALRAIREAGIGGIEDINEAIEILRERDILGGEPYEQWERTVGEFVESPETITPEVARMIYERARVPIEAQTQQLLRDIQRQYYSGGAPGGMEQMMIGQAKMSKIGQLGEIMRDIEIERALRAQEDRLRAIEAARQLAEYGGGVRERRGSLLASLLEARGERRARTASRLAEILGETIAAVQGRIPEEEREATERGLSREERIRALMRRHPGWSYWYAREQLED